MAGAADRAELLSVPLCGHRVVQRLAAIGIERLDDLAGEDPWDVLDDVNFSAGREIWWPPIALQAIENLVAAAEKRPPRRAAKTDDGWALVEGLTGPAGRRECCIARG